MSGPLIFDCLQPHSGLVEGWCLLMVKTTLVLSRPSTSILASCDSAFFPLLLRETRYASACIVIWLKVHGCGKMEGEKTQSVPYYQQPPLTGAALEVMHDGEEKRLFDERSTHKKRTDCYFTNVSHSSVSSKSSQQRKVCSIKWHLEDFNLRRTIGYLTRKSSDTINIGFLPWRAVSHPLKRMWVW